LPPQQSRYARRKPKKGGSANAWTLIGVAVAIAVVLIIAVIRGLGPHGTAEARTPVPAAVMQHLSQIPDATWDKVGAKGATPPVMVNATAPAATGTAAASAKPLVLYIGAEFCPYCAAERWSMITALSRFGTFQGLSYTSSATNDIYPGTPTFTFYGSTYTSTYIDLQTVETTTNIPASTPAGYTTLQTPTQAQQALFNKYDGPPYFTGGGSIPFILVGEKYAWQGASFSPQVLANTTQAAVAAQLAAGTTAAAQAILANANEISAAICAVDGGQPAAVCGSAGVKAAAATLPTKPAGQ
jgi:hypothetical protein